MVIFKKSGGGDEGVFAKGKSPLAYVRPDPGASQSHSVARVLPPMSSSYPA